MERHQPSLGRYAVLVIKGGRVPVHVAEERLLPGVDHLHRPAGVQRQQARVDLHGQVLARAERAADAGQHQPHLVFRQAQADRDLRLVHVQPLGGHVQLDPAVLGRHREAGLGPEERLVLHADLVAARDHDAGRGLRVSPPDPHVPDQVAAGVHRLRAGPQRGFGVGDRGQHLVIDRDRGGRAAGCFRVIGRDDHQRFALVADLADRPAPAGRRPRGRTSCGPARRRRSARRRPRAAVARR